MAVSKEQLKSLGLSGLLSFNALLGNTMGFANDQVPDPMTSPVAVATADGINLDTTALNLPTKEYTADDINAKIDKIFNNLNSTNETEKIRFRATLNNMSQTEIGKNALMDMPEDIPFQYDEVNDSATASFYGNKDNPRIVIHKTSDAEPNSNAITLAHEMRHANQWQAGIFSINYDKPETRDFGEAVIAKKAGELETLLQSAQMGTEMMRIGKTPEAEHHSLFANYYNNRLKHHEQSGKNESEAKQAANDDFIRAVWGHETEGLDLTPELQKKINNWNNSYDAQTARNIVNIDGINKGGQTEAKDALNLYCKRMNTSLTPDYLFEKQGKPQAFTSEMIEGTFIGLIPHGDITEKYDNGNIKSVKHYDHGIMKGAYAEYNEDGSLREKGQIENGLRNGVWEEHKTNGIVRVGQYNDGMRAGEWMAFFPDKSVATFSYEDDEINGAYEKRNAQGILISQGQYKKGEKDGVWKYYDENGHPTKSTTFKNGSVVSEKSVMGFSNRLKSLFTQNNTQQNSEQKQPQTNQPTQSSNMDLARMVAQSDGR